MPMIYQKSKVVLISSSILSAAIMLAATDFGDYVPSIYNGVVSWLKPPYLYLVINCIIISIVASAKFQSTNDDDLSPSETMGFVPAKSYPTAAEYKYDAVVVNDSSGEVEKTENGDSASVGGGGAFAKDPMSNKENECVMTWKAPANNDVKQPLSARFGHRRNVKASPQGGRTVLGVSKLKRQDTLENTWKTITEGRPVPISRHLKKSETMETQPHHKPITMKKSETFNDRSSTNSNSNSPVGKLRKEASLSQDELNRRVEAFINKFNQEMRLQRQHSLNQYREMIKP